MIFVESARVTLYALKLFKIIFQYEPNAEISLSEQYQVFDTQSL